MIKKQQFFTKINLVESKINLQHDEPITLLGSCFAQNMGEQLLENKFNVTINPFGIIYNPISIVTALKRIVKNHHFTENELTQFDSKWISFCHHGNFSNENQQQCLSGINTAIEEAYQHVIKSKTLFITFGSAWVYEYDGVGIVANCHKIPNKQFEKRLLSVKEIIAAFEDALEELKMVNPEIDIVFTVSPVRHVKDGLHENNLSKSTLHLAIYNMIEQHSNCSYFPAYELVIDELRDYRFYKDDLVHPTNMAVNYVWEKLLKCYCDETTLNLIESITKIKTAVSHKPFNFESAVHQQFIAKQLELMDKLTQQYLFLDFDEEKIELLNKGKDSFH